MADDLDVWDWAILLEHEHREEARMEFSRDISLDDHTPEQCRQHFHFAHQDLIRLCNLLRLPERMTTVNRVSAPGLEVLALVLKRLAYPCRYIDLQEFFRRPKSELVQLFHLGLDFIMDNFGECLASFNQPWLTQQRLLEYSEAVRNKGAPLPLCWGFIDGTVREICRPGQNQRQVYNGHKRKHALKFHSQW